MNEKPHSVFPGKSKEEIENIEKELSNVSMSRDDDFVEEKNVHDIIHLHENTESLNDVAVDTMEKADEKLNSLIEETNQKLSELKIEKRRIGVSLGILDSSLLKMEDDLNNIFKKELSKHTTNQEHRESIVHEQEIENKIEELELKIKEITESLEKIENEIGKTTENMNNIINILEPKNPNLN